MANEVTIATILDFSGTKPPNQANLATASPYFNNLWVMSGEYTQLNLRPPYYGDTVNLSFWKSININIGSSDFIYPLYQLIEGYQYIFNYSKKTFTVVDASGSIVDIIPNIKSMADMNISFDIYKSHQFIIQLDPSDTVYPFYIPAILKKRYFLPSVMLDVVDYVDAFEADYSNVNYFPIIGYLYDVLSYTKVLDNALEHNNNIYIAERVSGVSTSNIDFSGVYGSNYFYLDTFKLLQLWLCDEPPVVPPDIDPDKCYDEGDFWNGDPYVIEETRASITYVVHSNPTCCESSSGTGIGNQLVVTIHDLNEIKEPILDGYYEKGSVIEFYIDGIRSYYITKEDLYLDTLDLSNPYIDKICLLLLQIIKQKVYVCTDLKVDWLIPMWSMTLFSMLQPIIRDGETQNNRPIYEPWMIWGFYKFIYSKATEDIVDNLHEVPSWDLSPSWG